MSVVDTWDWDRLNPTEQYDEVTADEKVQAALYNFQAVMGIRPNRITMGSNWLAELRRAYGVTLSSNDVYEYEGIPTTVDCKNPNILEVGYVMRLWD